MPKFAFTSVLPRNYKPELERLLFFNPNQEKAVQDIPMLVERYGMAHVIEIRGRLRVVFESSPEPQTLYVLDQSDDTRASVLAGVMVYLREEDTLSLIIAAVHEAYAATPQADDEPLVAQMVDVLRDVGRRIQGIKSITLFPGTSRARTLST